MPHCFKGSIFGGAYLIDVSESMKQIIYIAGYGRSGSTLLDIILGDHPRAISLGETVRIIEDYLNPDSTCSCGVRLNECSFWSKIINRIYPAQTEEELIKIKENQRTIESKFGLFRIVGPFYSSAKERYTFLINDFFNTVFDESHKDVVIDSSKSAYGAAWRAYALSKYCKYPIKIIHLTRDGKSVVASKLRGDNRKLRMGINHVQSMAALRGIIGWNIANLIMGITKILVKKDSYLFIQYERFIHEPQKVLREIESFTGLSYEEAEKKIINNEPFEIGHLIGGNRITNQKNIVLRRTDNSQSSIKWYYSLLYFCFSLPCIIYFNYHKKK
jgi:hypothetical protein